MYMYCGDEKSRPILWNKTCFQPLADPEAEKNYAKPSGGPSRSALRRRSGFLTFGNFVPNGSLGLGQRHFRSEFCFYFAVSNVVITGGRV